MEKQLNWLNQQTPWVKYRTKIDLLHEPHEGDRVKKDYSEMINHQESD